MILKGNTIGKNTIEDVMEILNTSSCIQLKKERIKHIYEDDDFVIDLINAEEPMIRVSIFKDNHFQDEVFVRKDINNE